MVLNGSPKTSGLRPSTGSQRAMSILERSTLPPPPPAGSKPRSDRLRVITAGRVGNMDARLGTSGFDVVAVAETEDALIDAVSADEADAIVVEADLCDSLERVRDLAPDALLIVVGDHTPAGALGRIERGVSGTVMAGLLHALVAEGIGAAAVWGFVPAFGTAGRAASSPAHQRMASVRQSGSRPRVRCERVSRPRGTRYRGEHRRGDHFREPCADAERGPHARTSTRTFGARPRSRVGGGARAAVSGRRCVPHDANTRVWSLRERGRARRPTGAEPR